MTLISSYRITLVAYDPATNSLVTFLVGVSEQMYGRLNLMVFIARPQANSPSPLFKEAVWPQLGKEKKLNPSLFFLLLLLMFYIKSHLIVINVAKVSPMTHIMTRDPLSGRQILMIQNDSTW